MINVFTIYWYLQEMDTRQFYGRKEHDRAVRVIPSDSELEESENEDSEVEESHEDWIPESGLRDSLEVRGQSAKYHVCVCVFVCMHAIVWWRVYDKHAGRGSFEQKMAMVRETTLYAVKWYDNRSVTLLSDYTGAHPVTEVDRWDRK